MGQALDRAPPRPPHGPQVSHTEKTPLLTCLLEGGSGCGKSALAATVALESGFPFIKVVSPESMVGFSEQVRRPTGQGR